jgi:hypothetical protein
LPSGDIDYGIACLEPGLLSTMRLFFEWSHIINHLLLPT